MALEKINLVRGRAVAVAGDDVDTDRIIPARFMKCVTFDGLGDFLFYDVRFSPEGKLREHPLNDPRRQGARVLVAGRNFGCGSSREHAPQAIYRAGFRAIVAGGFAEIFFGNSTGLGIPCLSLAEGDLKELTAAVEADPELEVTVDVEAEEVRAAGKSWRGEIRPAARLALLAGAWDPIGELLEGLPQVDNVAGQLAYLQA